MKIPGEQSPTADKRTDVRGEGASAALIITSRGLLTPPKTKDRQRHSLILPGGFTDHLAKRQAYIYFFFPRLGFFFVLCYLLIVK